MNLFLALLKMLAFVSIAVVLALLTTVAAFFGSVLFPSRFFLPMAGAPRTDLWSNEERQQRLGQGVKNVSKWE